MRQSFRRAAVGLGVALAGAQGIACLAEAAAAAELATPKLERIACLAEAASEAKLATPTLERRRAASGFSRKIQPQAEPERHHTNIRQLTSGGENAEAYFSPDGTRLIYQSTRPDY